MLRIGQRSWRRKHQACHRRATGSRRLNTDQGLQLHIHIRYRGLYAACALRALLNLVHYALERVRHVVWRGRLVRSRGNLTLETRDLSGLLSDGRIGIVQLRLQIGLSCLVCLHLRIECVDLRGLQRHECIDLRQQISWKIGNRAQLVLYCRPAWNDVEGNCG